MSTVGLEPATPEISQLRALDLAAYGFDREVDHAFWEATGSEATMWKCDDEAVAYSYRTRSGIGPLRRRT